MTIVHLLEDQSIAQPHLHKKGSGTSIWETKRPLENSQQHTKNQQPSICVVVHNGMLCTVQYIARDTIVLLNQGGYLIKALMLRSHLLFQDKHRLYVMLWRHLHIVTDQLHNL